MGRSDHERRAAGVSFAATTAAGVVSIRAGRVGGELTVPRALRGRRWLLDLAAIALVAALARAILRHPALDTDPVYTLIWGGQVIGAHLPDLGYVYAPTAHPLANLEGVLAAACGHAAGVHVLIGISYASLGAVLWGAFRLGETLLGGAVGAGAALLVAINQQTLNVATGGFLDTPFVAMLVWAAVLQARRPRRPAPVLALLTVAGLLRPEAWILCAAYVLYASRSWPHRLTLAGVAVLAPLAWALMGLIVAGDALFAFTNARHTAAMRPTIVHSTGAQLASSALAQLRSAIRTPVLIAGLLGLGLALRSRRRDAVLPAAGMATLVMLAFGLITALRLPVPDRMLLAPGAVLAVFAAHAVLGWRDLPLGRERRAWAIAGAAVLALLLATTPAEVSRLGRLDARRGALAQASADLGALVRSPVWRRVGRTCRSLEVGDPDMIPYAAYYLGWPLARLGQRGAAPPDGGAYLAFASRGISDRILGYDDGWTTQRPTGFRAVTGNRSWRLYARGC